VVDLSVDGHFGYHDLINHTVNSRQFAHRSQNNIFDLIICFGLLYHLKNPITFLESLHKVFRYCMLGTWLMSFFPDNVTRIREMPIAYLLGAGELNNDASNYWIFSDSSFRRLAERTGFSIISSTSVFGREDRISNPVDINYGERGFLLLRSE
jgi:tRNA (mo5U34)-methyltransferase